ncbi:MAG: hypothetical protein IPL39_03025 [Opitutaceae bacterium]|nr:hypothetical protein [Opitutaceae bacterium]
MNQTPRDWLLDRHSGAVLELDALRRAVLPERRLNGREFLRELFRPALPAWAMLGVVWVALLALNASQAPAPEPPNHAPQFAATWSNPNAQLDVLLAETRALR